MQENVLIAGAGDEVGGADLDIGAEDVAESWETTGEEIGFGLGFGDDDHDGSPVRWGRMVKEG